MFLAMGTAKGNLMIYNARERKKTPYVGKHTKKVQYAVWNKDNLLATAGLDRQVRGEGGGRSGQVKEVSRAGGGLGVVVVRQRACC